MNNKPFFSIIIPTLNEEKYLPLLLNDLKQQSFQEFEIIVVDGQSEDQTQKIVQRFQKQHSQTKLIKSEVRNVSVQRNLGASNSLGQWLIFNDADNRLPPFFLEGIKYQLSANPTDLFTCWSSTDSQNTKDKTISTATNLILEVSLLTKSPTAFGAMIGCRKSTFNHGNGFDQNVGFAEDKDFVVKYYKAGFRFMVYKEPKYTYSLRRFHAQGTIKVVQKSSKLLLKYLTGKRINQTIEYPMGGKVFQEQNRNFFDKVNQILNTPIKAPKIIEKINSLIQLED